MSIETQKMELRSKVKSLEFRRSQVACKMARDCGIRGYFFAEDLELEDKRIFPNDVARFKYLSKEIKKTNNKLEQLVYGETRAHAREIVFSKINSMSLEEACRFLREYQCCSTLDLVEKMIRTPDLLEGEL